MAILPAYSAEKKSPFFPTESKLEDLGYGDGRKGALRLFEGGRLKGSPLELPGPECADERRNVPERALVLVGRCVP